MKHDDDADFNVLYSDWVNVIDSEKFRKRVKDLGYGMTSVTYGQNHPWLMTKFYNANPKGHWEMTNFGERPVLDVDIIARGITCTRCRYYSERYYTNLNEFYRYIQHCD